MFIFLFPCVTSHSGPLSREIRFERARSFNIALQSQHFSFQDISQLHVLPPPFTHLSNASATVGHTTVQPRQGRLATAAMVTTRGQAERAAKRRASASPQAAPAPTSKKQKTKGPSPEPESSSQVPQALEEQAPEQKEPEEQEPAVQPQRSSKYSEAGAAAQKARKARLSDSAAFNKQMDSQSEAQWREYVDPVLKNNDIALKNTARMAKGISHLKLLRAAPPTIGTEATRPLIDWVRASPVPNRNIGILAVATQVSGQCWTAIIEPLDARAESFLGVKSRKTFRLPYEIVPEDNKNAANAIGQEILAVLLAWPWPTFAKDNQSGELVKELA